jgi:hypothetical protein
MGRKFIECAIHHDWRRFGEATIFGWLERRAGKYLHSGYVYVAVPKIVGIRIATYENKLAVLIDLAGGKTMTVINEAGGSARVR